MSNRVVKDLIWTSPRLAKCAMDSQLHFPRLILLADDWGCFNADLDVIKGLVYPKINISKKKIESILNELKENGLLFIWQNDNHIWGYWAKWDEHNWASGSQYDSVGKRERHRRKTPEPPPNLLEEYLQKYHLGTFGNNVEHPETFYLNPNPNPNPNPNQEREEYALSEEFLQNLKEPIKTWLQKLYSIPSFRISPPKTADYLCQKLKDYPQEVIASALESFVDKKFYGEKLTASPLGQLTTYIKNEERYQKKENGLPSKVRMDTEEQKLITLLEEARSCYLNRPGDCAYLKGGGEARCQVCRNNYEKFGIRKEDRE